MPSINRSWFMIVAVTIAGLGGLAVAQAPRGQQPGTARAAQPGQAAPRENMDMDLAICVALENDNEIALAKVAQTRAESKEVVKFAEMMEKDHSQFGRDMERFSGNIAARRDPRAKRDDAARPNDGAATRRESAPRENQPVAPRSETNPAAGQPGAQRTQANPQSAQLGNVFSQIREELADECLESAQRELQDKKGAEFDACYLGMQLAAHMKMIDTLKVFEKHSGPELRQVFQKGLETSQKHFDQAKKIMKGLDGVRTAQQQKDSE